MFQPKLALHYGVSPRVSIVKISPLCCKKRSKRLPGKDGEGYVPADAIRVLKELQQPRQGASLHEHLLHWRVVLHAGGHDLRCAGAHRCVAAAEKAQQRGQAANVRQVCKGEPCALFTPDYLRTSYSKFTDMQRAMCDY